MLFILIIIHYYYSLSYVELFTQFIWSEWSEWPSTCSSTCKVGQRCRIRRCEDVKGNTVKSTNCGKAEDVKECQKCLSRGICPIDAGWSEWFEWTTCNIKKGTKCGKGTKKRVRICNNPKPKYDGMLCIGNSTDEGECLISCSDPSTKPGFLKDSINEHFKELNHNVQLVSIGDSVTLDCLTDAYLKATGSGKKFFINWKFNGIPLRTLKELILEDMKSLQKKLNKAGAKSSFQLPQGHIQFSGSKLIIDSITAKDSGVYTCVLNLNYVEYSSTFFVLLILRKFDYATEFDQYTFNSNTDGLEQIEPFDKAEIRWYMNRQLMFSGLLACFENRFYIVLVNKSMEGHWECHLFSDYEKTKYWVVNSFELEIWYPRSVLSRFSDIPVLYFGCYYFGFGIIMTIFLFLTSFFNVKSRIKTWLNYDRKEAIIEEEIENNRLLLIIARKRAMEKTIELMRNAGQKLDSIYEDYEPLIDDDEDEDDNEDENEKEKEDKQA